MGPIKNGIYAVTQTKQTVIIISSRLPNRPIAGHRNVTANTFGWYQLNNTIYPASVVVDNIVVIAITCRFHHWETFYTLPTYKEIIRSWWATFFSLFYFGDNRPSPYLGPAHNHFSSHWYSCFGFWALLIFHGLQPSIGQSPMHVLILIMVA